MNLINCFFLSALYFWCSSTSLSLGVGYYTFYRPVLSGMAAGLILGDYRLGMLAGTVVNIIYIDFVSTGGSLKGDQCLNAIIAAAAAILLKLSPVEAAAFAYPFGFIGILIWKYRLSINTIFVKKYELKFKKGMNPDISVYNGFLPQILLFLMSSSVMVISFFLLVLLKNIIVGYHTTIKFILFLAGIFLIVNSIINIILRINSRSGTAIFFTVLLVTVFFRVDSFVYMAVLLGTIICLSFDNIKSGLSRDHKQNGSNNKPRILNKGDLFVSWFTWMNFSHSCYNYERLQGMAVAHSMKRIAKKLYTDGNKAIDIIHQHAEFFNTEPNMGTPIHGYIIWLEEEKSMGNNLMDSSGIKRGMMGAAAGLGDSFTQVVLTPLLMSLSLVMCLGGKYTAAFIPPAILGSIIIYISYTGWKNGYYMGREYLLERINQIKKNKIKKYFHFIFGGMLGAVAGKLIMREPELFGANYPYVLAVCIISAVFTFAPKLIKKG